MGVVRGRPALELPGPFISSRRLLAAEPPEPRFIACIVKKCWGTGMQTMDEIRLEAGCKRHSGCLTSAGIEARWRRGVVEGGRGCGVPDLQTLTMCS
jgi:hypothetical protein